MASRTDVNANWLSKIMRDLAQSKGELTRRELKGVKIFQVVAQRLHEGQLWLMLANRHRHVLGFIGPEAEHCILDSLEEANLVGAEIDQTRPVLHKGQNKPHPEAEGTNIQLPPLNLYLELKNLRIVGEPVSNFRPAQVTQSVNCIKEVIEWLKILNQHPAEKNEHWAARLAILSSSQGDSQSQSQSQSFGAAVSSKKIPGPSSAYSEASYLDEDEVEPHFYTERPPSPPRSSSQQRAAFDADLDRMDIDGPVVPGKDQSPSINTLSSSADFDERTPTAKRLKVSDANSSGSAASSGKAVESLLRPSDLFRAASNSPINEGMSPSGMPNMAVFRELPFRHYTEVELVDPDLFESPPGTPEPGARKQRYPSGSAKPSTSKSRPLTVPNERGKAAAGAEAEARPLPSATRHKMVSKASSKSPNKAPPQIDLEEDTDITESFSSDDVFAGGKASAKRKRPQEPVRGRKAVKKATASHPDAVIDLTADIETVKPRVSPSRFGWLADQLLPRLSTLPPDHLDADKVRTLLNELDAL